MERTCQCQDCRCAKATLSPKQFAEYRKYIARKVPVTVLSGKDTGWHLWCCAPEKDKEFWLFAAETKEEVLNFIRVHQLGVSNA